MDKLAEINHGAKVVLGAAILFLILSFFNWQEVDLGAFGEAGVSMWHGVGWIAGLLAIAIIVWQAIRLANMNLEIGVGPAMVTAFLAVLLLLFTVIKFFADSEFRTWAAWVGLILAIVIAGGAWIEHASSRARASAIFRSSAAAPVALQVAAELRAAERPHRHRPRRPPTRRRPPHPPSDDNP